MFIAWQRAVGGRIKSDLRFNKLLTWNTFPVPTISEEQRASIARAGVEVLNARAQHPGGSLAAMYSPGAMGEALAGAHHLLDAEVDAAFGAPENASELERQSILFERYTLATAGRTGPGHSSGRSRGRRE